MLVGPTLCKNDGPRPIIRFLPYDIQGPITTLPSPTADPRLLTPPHSASAHPPFHSCLSFFAFPPIRPKTLSAGRVRCSSDLEYSDRRKAQHFGSMAGWIPTEAEYEVSGVFRPRHGTRRTASMSSEGL